MAADTRQSSWQTSAARRHSLDRNIWRALDFKRDLLQSSALVSSPELRLPATDVINKLPSPHRNRAPVSAARDSFRNWMRVKKTERSEERRVGKECRSRWS